MAKKIKNNFDSAITGRIDKLAESLSKEVQKKADKSIGKTTVSKKPTSSSKSSFTSGGRNFNATVTANTDRVLTLAREIAQKRVKKSQPEKAPVKTVLEKANPEIKTGIIDLTKSPVEGKVITSPSIGTKGKSSSGGGYSTGGRDIGTGISDATKKELEMATKAYDKALGVTGHAQEFEDLVNLYLSSGTRANTGNKERDKIINNLIDLRIKKDNAGVKYAVEKQNQDDVYNGYLKSQYGIDTKTFGENPIDLKNWADKNNYIFNPQGNELTPKYKKGKKLSSPQQDEDAKRLLVIANQNQISKEIKNSKAAAVFYNAANTIASPARGIAGGLYTAKSAAGKLFGQDVDIYDELAQPQYISEAIKGATQEEYTSKWFGGKEVAGIGNVGNFLYGAGTSALESAVNATFASYLTGGLGLSGEAAKQATSNITSAIMGSDVAANTLINAKRNGQSDGKAIIEAIAAGTAEWLTEKYSVETILDEVSKGNTNFLKTAAKSFVAEGSEEVASNWLNRLVDSMVNPATNDIAMSYYTYLSQGVTPKDAMTQSMKDILSEDFQAGLAGGLSGVAMGGAFRGVNAIQQFKTEGNTFVTGENKTPVYDKNKAPKGFLAAVDKGLTDFIERVKKNPADNKSTYTIGKVSNRLSTDIEKLTGITTKDFTHRVKANSIRHIINRHGKNGMADHSLANTDDIARIGYVLDNYGDIELLGEVSAEFRDKNQKPSPMIKISQKVDGTYYVVEAVPDTKAKSIEVVSAYIEKTPMRQTEDVQAPSQVVRNASADNGVLLDTTIPQYKSGVKNNFMQKSREYSNYSILQFAKTFGDNGKNIFTRFYNDGQNMAEYSREMNAVYEAGKMGKAMPRINTISQGQAQAMYQAGQVDTQNTVGIIQNNTSERFRTENPKIYNTLNGLGKKLNAKIVIDENIEGADGYFNPTSGELHINRNAQNPVNVLIKHEITHIAEGTKQYSELLDFMKDSFSEEWAKKEADIIDLYERINRKRALKGQEVITLTDKRLNNEVMAEFAERFDSDAFLERIATENPSMLTKIRDFIRDIIDRLKNVFSDSELKRLQKAERMWENAIKNADATQRNGDVEYKIITLADGKRYVKANEQVIKSDDSDLWANEIMDYVNKVVRKGEDVVIPMDNEEDIVITGRTAWKLGDKGKYDNDFYFVKGNAAGVIDEIVSVSKYDTTKPPMKEHSDDFGKKGFDYRTAYFEDLDGEYYRLDLSVGLNDDGKEMYNIGRIKKVGQHPASTAQRPYRTSPNNNKVPQNEPVVNTYSMQNLKNNAEKEYKLQEPVDVETENTELKRQLEDVQTRLKEAQTRAQRAEERMRPQVLEKDIQSLAGKLIKEYGSDLKKADIADDLRDLGNYILRMGDGNNVYSFDNLKYRANKIADTIIEYAKEETPFAETYKQIKSYFKDTKITVTQKGDFADYEAFRKSMFGKMRLVNEGGTAIDTIWAELGEMYGENLFPSEITAESDMIHHIADFLTDMDDVYYNPYDQTRGEMRELIANGIISELTNNVRTVALGDALDLNEKLIAEKKRTAEIMRLRTEIKNTEAALAAEWERLYQERAKQLKEQQKFKDKKQAQEERAERQRLLKIAKTLTSKRFYDNATEATRAEIDKLIGDLDTAAVGILKSTKNRLSEWGDRYREIAETNPDFIPNPQIEADLRRIGQKRIADMDIDDVRNLTDALITIEHEMHTANRLLAETEHAEIKKNGLKIISDIMATKGQKGEKRNSFMSDVLSPERMINRIIGYNKKSPLVKAYRNLQNGAVKMLEFQMEANRRFDRYTSDKKFIDSIKGKSARAITIMGTTEGGRASVKITPAMLMSLYMHSQNFQNLRHIAKGGLVVPDYELMKKGKTAEAIRNGTTIHMTRSEINMAVKNLTAKEMEFCYAMTEYFKWSGSRINEVSNILAGHDIARVGNYFPIASDKNFLDTDFTIMNDDGSLSSMGFLHERKNATNPIYLFGADDVVTRSIENQSRYIGLAIPVRDMNKLLNVADIRAQEVTDTDDKFDKTMAYGTREIFFTESVKSAIVKRWGDATYSYIEKMMHDVQGMSNQLSESEQKFAKLKSHAAAVALGVNIGVALKQHPSYWAAAVELDFNSLAKGYIMPVNKKLLSKSPLYWYRELGYNNTEFAEIRKQGIKFPKWANPIQGMDLFTVRKLLCATEAYIRKTEPNLKGEEYEKAVLDKYHDVIRRTQPNYTTLERNGISRDRSAMAQFLSFMRTQPFQNLNILLDAQGDLNAQKNRLDNLTKDDAEYEQAKKDFETARNRNTRAVISQAISGALFVTLGFVVDALKHRTKGYRDEDDELTVNSVLKKLGINFLGNTVGMIPAGSEIWGIATYTIDRMLKTAGKNKIFDTVSYGVSSPQIEFLNDVTRDVSSLLIELEKGIINISNGEDVEWEKLARISFNALGQLAAFKDLPFNNIKNDLFMIAKNAIYAAKGKEEGKYWDLRLEYEPQDNKKEFYDLLYKAQGTKVYEATKKRLIENDGFTEKDIEDAMTDRYLEKKTHYKDDADKILKAGKKTDYYASLSEEEQKDFEKKVMQYAKGVALKNRKEPDKWITVAEKLNKASDIPVEKFIEIYTECSEIESDKDAQGKTINNSRGIKRKKYIDSQVRSLAARKEFYDLLQVGKEVRSGKVTSGKSSTAQSSKAAAIVKKYF